MIDVYFLDVSCFSEKNIFDIFYQNVSFKRKEKIDRYVFENDKKLSLGAGVLVDVFLKSRGYRERYIEYFENENGKPFFKDLSQFKFSISHSKDKVMVCFSDSEIGCDIEKISNADLRVAKRYFTEKEYAFLSSLKQTDANDYFYRIWTAKESFLKAIGVGIKKPMNSFETDFSKKSFTLEYDNKKYYFNEVEFFSDYKIFVCSEKNQEIKIKYVDLEKEFFDMI